MDPKLGLTRNVVRRRYALVTPDGRVPSALPGWTRCTPYVLVSAAMGARFSQLLIDLEAGGEGHGYTGGEQWFFYVVAGGGRCNGHALTAGGYAFVPADAWYEFTAAAAGTRVLVFRKAWEPTADASDETPGFCCGHEREVPGSAFLGDERARLQTLLPDSASMDLAVNVFTFAPGATLPCVETHVMEHGMLFLEGGGVYRLGEDWHPVQAGDALWIGAYCPQWFIAAGPQPARYLYYKDVNRLP